MQRSGSVVIPMNSIISPKVKFWWISELLDVRTGLKNYMPCICVLLNISIINGSP